MICVRETVPSCPKRMGSPVCSGLRRTCWSPRPLTVPRLVVFDLNTQKWSDLVPGPIPGGVVNWAHSPDYKYVYYIDRRL